MTARIDRTRRARAGAAATIGAALLAAAACTPVAGTATSQAGDESAYKAHIAASRAAAAEAATRTACASWDSNRDTRLVASNAMTGRTAKGDWTWPDINSLVSAAISAQETEAGKLPAIIDTAAPNPDLQSTLREYQRRLDDYTVGLRADQSARRDDWAGSNPAVSPLNTSVSAIRRICD